MAQNATIACVPATLLMKNLSFPHQVCVVDEAVIKFLLYFCSKEFASPGERWRLSAYFFFISQKSARPAQNFNPLSPTHEPFTAPYYKE
jgi:hypothetical protein